MSNKNTPGGRVRVCKCPLSCRVHPRQEIFGEAKSEANSHNATPPLVTMSNEQKPQVIETKPFVTTVDELQNVPKEIWTKNWRRSPYSI